MSKPEAKPAPLMLARIPNTRHGRAALAGIREFLNRDGYRLAVEFSGPRRKTPGGWLRYGTLKADATAFRLYVTRKHTPAEIADAHTAASDLWAANQRIDALERKLLAEVERSVSERRTVISLQQHLAVADEERSIAQNHAIDQDSENEKLFREVATVNAELASIPMWLRRLVKWARNHSIFAPDPLG